MATTTSDNRAVRMDNGTLVSPLPDWESLEAYRGPKGDIRVEVISYPNGGEDWFTDYRPELIDGLAGGLADGETFTSPCGGTRWQRHGDEMHVRSMGRPSGH